MMELDFWGSHPAVVHAATRPRRPADATNATTARELPPTLIALMAARKSIRLWILNGARVWFVGADR